jgi:hypothetical protein
MGTPDSVIAKCCTLTRNGWVVGCGLEWVHGMVFARELGRVLRMGLWLVGSNGGILTCAQYSGCRLCIVGYRMYKFDSLFSLYFSSNSFVLLYT